MPVNSEKTLSSIGMSSWFLRLAASEWAFCDSTVLGHLQDRLCAARR